MQGVIRSVSIAYLIFLTVLLLSRDPSTVVGYGGGLPWILGILMPYSHIISFTVAAVLATCVRWPAPRWAIVTGLIAYGGFAELLQNFVPPRHPCWRDWGYDIMGVTADAMLCWGFAALLRDRNVKPAVAGAQEDFAKLRKIVRHAELRQQSWWT
jgi:hypothetical protein